MCIVEKWRWEYVAFLGKKRGYWGLRFSNVVSEWGVLGDFFGNFARFCAFFGKNGVVLCVSSAAKLGAPKFISLR